MRHRTIESTQDLSATSLRDFDVIIDVRSPAEYEDDHVPGAISLPVLSDAERAEVGTIYKQQSQFEARRVGAAFVARNVASHLNGPLARNNADSSFLVYCWRGGMRSGAFATISSAIGWKVSTISGGYKTWRRTVLSGLDELPDKYTFILIDGQTGTAKTELLHCLASQEQQVIDLEGLARHRGSLFGDLAGIVQPTQKAFESALYSALRSFDPKLPVFLEAESNRIGSCRIPDTFWKKMVRAHSIEVVAEPVERVRHLLETYHDLTRERDRTSGTLDRLRPYHSRETIDHWQRLLADRQYRELAYRLMTEHYDPAYERSRRKRKRVSIASLKLPTLDENSLKRAAQDITNLNSATRPKGSALQISLSAE